jgi:hypothetical protein
MDYSSWYEEHHEGVGWRGTREGGDWYEDRPRIDVQQALRPLRQQLDRYDTLRTRLQAHGGRVSDLQTITALLNEKLVFTSRWGETRAALTEQTDLRAALRDIDYDLHLAVRQLESGMPVYYLCRIRSGFWSEYSLIVEDLYRSPGYPSADDRFVKLMSFGHETFHLRLAQFRDGVKQMLRQDEADEQKSARQVDRLLYDLGRHVFQAAWHEDQQIGVLVAEQFGLPNFRAAIELLYLCLSGELCELRAVVTPPMLQFFTQVYPQPALGACLERLQHLDGEALNKLPQQALRLYARMAEEFGRFLKVEVPWGQRQVQVPLWKLVFGNAYRLPLVGQALAKTETMRTAAARLEAEAQAIIAAITDPTCSSGE